MIAYFLPRVYVATVPQSDLAVDFMAQAMLFVFMAYFNLFGFCFSTIFGKLKLWVSFVLHGWLWLEMTAI